MNKSDFLAEAAKVAKRELMHMPDEVVHFIHHLAGFPMVDSHFSPGKFEPVAFYDFHEMDTSSLRSRTTLYVSPPEAFSRFAGLDEFLTQHFPKLPANLRMPLNFLVNHEVCSTCKDSRYLIRYLPFEALWGVLRTQGLVDQDLRGTSVKKPQALRHSRSSLHL